MPIQIIDNFELGASKPIDNRFVVGAVDSFYADKNDIPYKYIGLRVWDLTGGAPGTGYVWDGTAWQGEAGGSVVSTGSSGYIPKFLSPASTISNSLLYETPGGNIGISTTTPDKKLTVNGAIKSSTGGFYGNGSNITSINASNITTGSLNLARLAPGTSTYIITQGGGGPQWTDPSTITVGNATEADKVYYQTSSSSNFLPILFSESTATSGYHALREKTAFLAIKPSDGSIRMSAGTGNVVIGYVTPDPNYKVHIRTTGDYGLKVDKNGSNGARVYLNGPVGIGTSPSTNFGLSLYGGSSYPLNVSNVGGKSAYFQSSVGIGISPSTTYKLWVNGWIKANDIHLGSPSYNYHRLVVQGSADLQYGLFMNIGYSGAWKASTPNPGLALYYQTYAATNKYILYTNPATTPGSVVSGPHEVLRIDPNDTSPDVEFINSVGIGTNTFNWTTSGSRFHEGPNTSWSSASNGTSKLAVNGGISCQWIVTLSDKRLKKNINPIKSSLDKILKLNAVEYEWNEITGVKNYGFIAQEVEEVIPEIIRYYEDKELEGGKMTLHYESFIAHLTKSIQEQQKIINGLEERLKKLES